MTLNREDVIIFWDYETTSLTSAASSVSGYELVKNLRAAVTRYGPIKAFRAYADYTQLPQGSHGRIELSSSGVTLVDCPSEGRKDVQAKIMISDMLIHAWDHSPPHTFVVITADRDLAYPIALLRTRDYRVVLICPSTVHPSLAAQASAGLDWTRVVLGFHGDTVNGGDFFDHDSGAKDEPPSGGLPRAPRSDAGTRQGAYQASSSRQMGLNGHDYSKEQDSRTQENPLIENPSRPLPPRPRRNSTFPGLFDSQKFNEFGNGFATPRPARGPLGPLNERPLFPRPRSRTTELSRADSAPPNIRQGGLPTPLIPSFAPSTTQPEAFSKIDEWASSLLKGKGKDLEPFEDFTKDDVVPEETLEAPEPTPAPVPTEGSESAKGKGKASPAAVSPSPLPGARESPPSRSSSFSSRSSSSSLQTEFSLVAPPIEPTTAPTSAQTADSTKSDATFKAANVSGSGGLDIDGRAPAEEVLAQDDFEALFRNTGSQTELLGARSPPTEDLVNVTVEDEERERVVFSAPSPVRIPSPLSQAPATTSTHSTPLAKSVAVASPAPSAAGNLPSNSGVPKPQATVAVPPPAVPNKPKGGAAKTTVAVNAPADAAAGPSTSASPPRSVPLSAVPLKFRPLVEVLRQEQRGERRGGVDKSHLGSVLPKKFPLVYQQAKCAKFKTYIGLALEAGIVSEVVKNGEQCVSLSPEYRA